MEVKPLEVLSEDSNYGIVRMPGRSYPGCVVQGDSLYILWKAAREIAAVVRDGTADSGELLAAVRDLHDDLLDRLLHYQAVLRREGIDLPYVRPVEASFLGSKEEDGPP